MKTADRLLAGPLGPPFSLKRYPDQAREWRDLAASTRALLPTVPHLLADNVARYVFETPRGYVLEEFPCLAPPWPAFWIEYVSRSGRQRRGVLVRDVTDRSEATVESASAGASADARENGYTGEIRWLVEFTLYAENQRKQVIGPMGWVVLALDPRGRCVGNRWVIGIPKDYENSSTDRYRHDAKERAQIGQTMQVLTDTTSDVAAADAVITDDRLTAGLLAAYQTLAFLHCRNTVTDDVDVPPKLDKRHQRDHGRPLLRFQTVRLEVPRKSSAATGRGIPPAAPPLHIVPGNFHHYGDCCPVSEAGVGGHPPKGLLFGKLEGVFWVPQHARGNPERGEVRSDFDLQVKGNA
jgi:hypothetical protein